MLAIAAFRLHSVAFTIVVIVLALTITAFYVFRPDKRRNLGTNVNNMDTMLLGGLWHGASFNFITWGGLNGIGILIYKWWKERDWMTHIVTLGLTTLALTIARAVYPAPLVKMLQFVSLVCLIVYTVLHLLPQTWRFTRGSWTVWFTLLTFVFISFTRLFFRSGSNLDPAGANEMAWMTASLMVDRIGSRWDLAQIPVIVAHYWKPFALFVVGMAVHWLPARLKRRYRL